LKEGPISYTNENVLAIQALLKTHTRRVIVPQPNGAARFSGCDKPEPYILNSRGEPIPLRCPWQPGDGLWVKEGYHISACDRIAHKVRVTYTADTHTEWRTLTDSEWQKWTARKHPHRATPGRFMYKSLARIWLEVVKVRVERVQEIRTLTDIPAEGINPKGLNIAQLRGCFMDLWDSINAKRGYSWAANPFVWAVDFKVAEK